MGELKHSRWSLLWFCCLFLVLPLPSGSMLAQCPELSLPWAAWSNSRHGSWVSSSTLLMPLLMWLEGRRGPSPSQELCQELETLLPSRLGSSSSSNTSTLSPSGLPLQEEQRGPCLSLESNPQAKAEWYWALQAHQAQLAAHEAQLAGRKKRSNIVASLPLPGTSAVAALTPEQAAFWYQAQLLQAQNEIAVAGK